MSRGKGGRAERKRCYDASHQARTMPVQAVSPSHQLRFASFEVDLRTGELRKSGMRIKLQDQPFRILAALLESPGELVTRAQLKERIWPDTEFGDFDHALNLAINKLRIALGDSSDAPRFIETLPRYGYRFIASVETVHANEVLPSALGPAPDAGKRRWHWWAVAAIVVAVVIAVPAWKMAPRPAIDSVAVMPFATDDPELRYLGDGIAQSLTEDLAHVPQLHVISHNSAFQLRGAKLSTHELSERLKVHGLVTGSIRRAHDGNLILEVELLNARSDKHIWGNEYTFRRGELAGASSRIAQDVFLGLRHRLDATQQERLGHRHTGNSDAYDAYLRGMHAIANHEREKVADAERWFKEAVRLDPNFVLGYVGLEEAYGVKSGIGGVQPKPALLLAEEAAQRALQLGPDFAESHVAIAYMQLNLHRNLPAAVAETKRAIELDPNLATAHVAYAGFLNVDSQHLQAADEARKAMSLDPEWLFPKVVYAVSQLAAGRFQESEAFARTLPPPQGPRLVAIALVRQGKAAQALRELQEAAKHGPVYDYGFLLEWGNAELGRPELLRAGAARAVELRRTRYFSATNVAILYSLLRDRENTLSWLKTAFEEYDPLLYQFGALQGGPEWLRDDLRYKELRRMMFTPE